MALNNVTLAKSWEQTPVLNTFLKNRYFKDVKLFDTAKVAVEIKHNGQQVAPWVHHSVGGKLLERQGGQITEYVAPETAPQRITSYDDVMAQGTKELITGAKSPQERANEIAVKDLRELDEAITRREEYSIAEIITTGKLLVKGEGYDDVIEFWPATPADKPYKKLAGASLWSAATATIIADVAAAQAWVQEKTGITPTDLILGAAAAQAVIANKELLALLDNKGIQGGSINIEQLPQGASYLGRLPVVNIDLFTYGATMNVQDSDDGTVTVKKLIPDNYAVLASPSNPTVMAYGVVAINDVKAQEVKYLATDRAPNTYLQQKNPAGRIIEIKSRPLPIVAAPQAFYVLEVL